MLYTDVTDSYRYSLTMGITSRMEKVPTSLAVAGQRIRS